MPNADQMPSLEETCPRGGEDLPCKCYWRTWDDFTREEAIEAAKRWRERALEAEAPDEPLWTPKFILAFAALYIGVFLVIGAGFFLTWQLWIWALP